jgi:hypothetical protein
MDNISQIKAVNGLIDHQPHGSTGIMVTNEYDGLLKNFGF